MNGTIITIDSNEAMHHPEFTRMQWEGCLVCVAPLLAGDVQIAMPDGTVILIERKAPHDLMESVKDRRLFNQVTEMKAVTDWVYVLVHGIMIPTDAGEKTSYMHPNGQWISRDWQWGSIQGILISCQELGTVVMHDNDFHGAIQRIMQRSRNEVKIAPRREQYVFSPAESLLMTVPGIGAHKAQEIMSTFGGVLGVALEWLTDPGMFEPKIDGIGAKTKLAANEFFNGKLELNTEAVNE